MSSALQRPLFGRSALRAEMIGSARLFPKSIAERIEERLRAASFCRQDAKPFCPLAIANTSFVRRRKSAEHFALVGFPKHFIDRPGKVFHSSHYLSEEHVRLVLSPAALVLTGI
jgi:hypothetical protein